MAHSTNPIFLQLLQAVHLAQSQTLAQDHDIKTGRLYLIGRSHNPVEFGTTEVR